LDIANLTIRKAGEAMVRGDFTARELTDAYLAEIEKRNGELNAYLYVFTEHARVQADEVDKKRAGGEKLGPLAGIPLAIKDNILIEGEITSSASKILENYKATYDATVIARLRSAGAVFLGHTNMDEFAMGASNENSAYGPVKNPLDTTRVPGGSSGGSAVAVAGNMALGALGSDTGGSVRQPASFCGLVGMKPTYGAVSRYGLIAMASSLDQIGPLAKNVEDAQIIFDCIKGRDKMDSTSEEYPTNENVPKEITIGVPTDFPKEGLDSEVLKNFEQSVEKLKGLGYKIKEISLPNIKYSVACYYIIMPAEISSNLARFDGVRYGLHVDGKNLLEDYKLSKAEGFGPETKRRIILGTYVLSAGYYDSYYGKALAVQSLIRRDFDTAFNEVQAIIMPTTPGPAFRFGEKSDNPVEMYLEDIFTISANLSGLPAVSVPSGLVEKEGSSLPLGLQIITPHFAEAMMFGIAERFRQGLL